MKIELWWIGKTNFDYLDEGIEIYNKRLKHYTSFNILSFEDVKNASKLDKAQLKKKEAEMILKKVPANAMLVLLDEKGKEFSSESFAMFLQDQLNYSSQTIIFLIGGAFGFDKLLYERADRKLSLSRMTFSHQMVRLFFVEQLYRAFSIINNEKYHNS